MTGERRNRLANERSPYLQGHAADPVDWYPWGEEAFERARREDKPLLLSIGYSACHWCHVMHRDSFEDPETASILNDVFVCVKVDREERPDIDKLYMEASIAMTGSGGWPLTILLTPERIPFFAATYLPRESRGGMIGLRDLARAVKKLWSERRKELLASGEEVLRAIGVRQRGEEAPGEGDIQGTAYLHLRSEFDPEWGGFGRAMKFPLPQHLMYLSLHHYLTKQEESLSMVERTLERMWQGGIHDHVGFGFHRYTTDRAWRAPHFEKMLYDQAFLIAAYTQTYLLTGVEGYAQIARWTGNYLLSELSTNGGGFAASQSAESGGMEGAYYLWREKELIYALDDEVFPLFQRYFRLWKVEQIAAGGGEEAGGVLHLDPSLTAIRERDGRLSPASAELERIRRSLQAARETRSAPERDTKVLTDWNGYAVAALAIAGRTLGERGFLEAAEEAMEYLLKEHATGEEDLFHVGYRRGTEGNSFASDWAAVIWGLIELHQSTLEQKYLLRALSFNHRFIEKFWDREERTLSFTPKGSGDLPFTGRDIQDGPIPSSSAIALQNLVRLYWLTGDLELRGYAREMAEEALREASASPLSCTGLLCGKMLLDMPPIQVVFSGSMEDPEIAAAIRLIRRYLAPNLVIHRIQREAPLGELLELAPALEGIGLDREGKGIHLCTGFTCRRPISDVKELERELVRVLYARG